jgi:hypothetical protein
MISRTDSDLAKECEEWLLGEIKMIVTKSDDLEMIRHVSN